mmetsp:Transcript_27389/g.46283  ORF Transcript_27389/g.46283 Transcript_27389/m.46283 type:complete len:112 (+) Transcript_27389:76-411(+)
MANFEEEIRNLMAEITKNTARLDKAIDERDEDREERYVNLITESRKTLNILLQQQSQAQAGGGQGTVDNATAIALTAALQGSTSVNRELPDEVSAQVEVLRICPRLLDRKP